MIFTITLNPAIDRTITLASLSRGEVNRTDSFRVDCGGKGINVSKMLSVLGEKSIAMGFLGRKSLNMFSEYLSSLNIQTDFCLVEGESRMNIKIVETDEKMFTDINEKGPVVTYKDVKSLIEKINATVGEEDIVVLSGSISNGIETDIYKILIEQLNKKNVKVILDCDGDALKQGILGIPYAVKPNVNELKNIISFDENNILSIIEAGKKFINMGIQKVIISMGSEGALFISKEEILQAYPLKVEVKSTVGAGDSMVSGLAYGLTKKMNDIDTLKLSCAAATAAVMCEGTCVPDYERIKEIEKKIIIERR